MVDQNYDAAIFQDLGSQPATMEASKAADFYGCVPGHALHVADAEQAYVQAPMKGTPTWVAIPPEHYPEKHKHLYSKLKRPVCRLLRSLYGHPDSGTNWEEFADAGIKKSGFRPMGEEWPACYFHDKLKLMLVVYVDDFKLAGPKQNMTAGWDILRKNLGIEDPVPHRC